MDESLAKSVQELLDRQQIEAALLRYCRGVDRHDKELMLSAYHPDAIDDHGMVVLQAEAFVDWALAYHAEHNPMTHHAITNLTIDLDGDAAHSECYFMFIGTAVATPSQLAFGRYVDRLERRDGRWAIAARFCFTEAVHDINVATMPEAFRHLMASNGPQARNRTDASYQRPLVVDPRRIPG